MNPYQGNKTKTNPSASETHDVKDGDNNDHKFETSTSYPRSYDENIMDPFALLELRDNVASVVSHVNSLDKIVAKLDSNLNQKVTSLDSKLALILKSLSEIKEDDPQKSKEQSIW